MGRSLRYYLLFSLGFCVYFVPFATKAEAQAAALPVPPAAAQPEAAVDDGDGFVKVGDITYVKGREPKSLAEPPPPSAVPRPEVSAQVAR